MRIIGGEWAGRDLTSPVDPVRPTAEGLRRAGLSLVEDAMGEALKGARVLELFAGTGALGLETLSRGAATCDFVENHSAAIHALKANVAALGARPRSRVFIRDAIPFAERLEPDRYDLAIVDPPYGSRKLDRVLSAWRTNSFSRYLLVESALDHDVKLGGPSQTYGDGRMTLLSRGKRG